MVRLIVMIKAREYLFNINMEMDFKKLKKTSILLAAYPVQWADLSLFIYSL